MKNIAHIRLLSQQLECPQMSSPAELVQYMGPMQAQDLRMVQWAVGLRMKGTCGQTKCKKNAAAMRCAWNTGQILRMHLQRGTWQLIAADDYGWLLPLLGPKSMTVTKGWLRASGYTIPVKDEQTAIAAITDFCQTKGSATRAELTESILEKGVVVNRYQMDFLLRMSEMRGLLCSGKYHPTQATYAYAPDRIATARIKANLFCPAVVADKDGVPTFVYEEDRNEALRLLAAAYFRSHQPATLEDFVWWSGLTAGDCKKGIAMLGSSIHSEQVGVRSYYIMDGCRTHGHKKDGVILLPAYDEYLIGYKSREVALQPQYSHFAHDKKGIFYPVVAVDGQIVGNWTPTALDSPFSFFIHFPENKQSAILANLEKVRAYYKAFISDAN